MCSRPQILLEPFARAGADEIIIHVELRRNRFPPLIWKIKQLERKSAWPSTRHHINEVQPYLEQIDLLLVMTVNPGFGGQSFIHETLPKIQQAETWRRERKLPYRISVDGGINFPDRCRMRPRRRGHFCPRHHPVRRAQSSVPP